MSAPTQLSIFDREIARERVLPPHRDNEASKAAASYIEPFCGSLRARILDEIKRRGECGATADELCICFGAVRNSIAPRLTELKDKRLIRDSKRTRKMVGQNVAATVWVLNKEASE